MAIANTSSAPILTADGIPLRVSLRRSMRRSKLRAMALVLARPSISCDCIHSPNWQPADQKC